VLDYISAFSVLFPLAAALYKFRQLNTGLKILGVFFIFSAAVEAMMIILSGYGVKNVWLANVFALLEAAVYFYLCGRWFNLVEMFKAVMWLFIMYFIYWLLTTFFAGSFLEFNDKEKVLKGIFLIGISGYLLIRISAEDSIMLVKDYRFWILSAILIYFSISEVVFATANFILDNNHPAMEYVWAIHSMINIISNLLFAYGFVCYYRKVNFSI
jgi:hypothetical protein